MVVGSSLIRKEERLAKRATRCHSLALVNSLALIVSRCATSLALVVFRCVACCATRCDSLSLVVAARCHSLSLDVLSVCLFVGDHRIEACQGFC